MKIEIFDVEHGACIVATSPGGKRLMMDCGHNASKPWRPSVHYKGQHIENLVINNYDEDHVSDLVDLMASTNLAFISRNTTVSANALAHLKAENGMGNGIARLKKWMDAVEGRPSGGTPDLDTMCHRYYYNSYPKDFDDENNLSVLSIVECSGFKLVYGGDMETSGWEALITRNDVRSALVGTNVFVASHHGRNSGQCQSVMDLCMPQIVVMSDRDKQFNSQETVQWYRGRCSGINYANGRRHVFTTRRDGNITINVGATSWSIFCGL
jgi:beta-lactamase superfamily II metal-dependent hydrolase